VSSPETEKVRMRKKLFLTKNALFSFFRTTYFVSDILCKNIHRGKIKFTIENTKFQDGFVWFLLPTKESGWGRREATRKQLIGLSSQM
jgi:hypothetical protein